MPAFLSGIRWLLRKAYGVRITGDLEVLAQGPRLVVANCDSALDGVLLGLLLPRQPLVATTAQMHARRLVRWLLRWVPHCPAYSAQPARFRRLVRHLRAGGLAVIFPQGDVTTGDGLINADEAAGMLAAQCGCAFVPVRISGTRYSRYACTSRRWPRRWFPQVTITVHAPVVLAPAAPGSAKSRRRACARAVQAAMQRAASHDFAHRNLFDAFVDAVSRYGRYTSLVEDVRRQPQSYGDLLKAALGLGRLLARETRAGETVGVLMPSVATTLSLVLGLTAQGRVAAMLNYSAGTANMQAACITAGVRTVITSRPFLDALGIQNAGESFKGMRLLYAEDLRQTLTLGDKLWLFAFALWRPRAAVPSVDPGTAAVILFTSGSEGTPKGVVLSHAAMLANMAQLRSVIDFGPDDKFFSALPLYHIFGLVACGLMPLMSGTRLFLYVSPLHYRTIPGLVRASGATYLFGTSTFLSHYARQAQAGDFDSLRRVISGGEKLSAEVVRLWRDDFGQRIYEGYGATECGPAMSLNAPLAFKSGTVGRFLPHIEYRLLPVPGIVVGQALHVRGPNLMSGYLHSDRPGVLVPPRCAAGEGWHDTGDIVEVDAEGFVTFVGRTRRFAKVAGEMISLDTVERLAGHVSPLHRHAAVAAPLAATGEGICLFTTDAGLERATLLRTAGEYGVSPLAAPRWIERVEELPQLGNGKTDYVALSMRLTHSASPAAR